MEKEKMKNDFSKRNKSSLILILMIYCLGCGSTKGFSISTTTTSLSKKIGTTRSTAEQVMDDNDDPTARVMEDELLLKEEAHEVLFESNDRLSEHKNIQKWTDILLNKKSYPAGTLPKEVLRASMETLNGWCKSSCSVSASTAQRILDRLEEEEMMTGVDFKLNQAHYCAVMDGWIRSNDKERGFLAEKIFKRIEERSEMDPSFRPDRITYNCMMHAWAKHGQVSKVEAILRRMIDDPNIRVESGDYHAVMHAYSEMGDAQKTESLLMEMIQSSNNNNGNNTITPDLISFNIVLNAWASCSDRDPTAAQRAEYILLRLIELYKKQQQSNNNNNIIKPDTKSFSAVVKAYAEQHNQRDSIDNAHRILKLAEENHAANESFIYNLVLKAWTHSNRYDAPERAEEFLMSQLDVGRVDTVSFNTVILAWKNARGKKRDDILTSIMRLLNQMEQLQQQSSKTTTTTEEGNDDDDHGEVLMGLDVKPDVYTYSLLIDTLAKGASVDCAKKALTMLQRMIQSCQQDGNSHLKPNVVTVNSVLDALAKSGDFAMAREAEQLLVDFGQSSSSSDTCKSQVQLNSISYTTVMDAYVKSGGGKRPIQNDVNRVFDMMKQDFANGNSQAKPTTRTFNVLLHAWSSRGQEEELEMAESILRTMADSQERPNVISYSIVMNGWARSSSPLASQKVESLFDDMARKDVSPNAHAYAALIHSLTRCGSADKAERCLYSMYDDYVQGDNEDVKLNPTLITMVINAWGKSGTDCGAERAEALLEWMIEKQAEHSNDVSFRPSEVTYSSVINAWAKSNVFGKANRARAILDKVIKNYESGKTDVKPNEILYTSVMNACAYAKGDTQEKLHAFKLATKTFNDLSASKYGNPNEVTYQAFITACRNLLPPGDMRTSATTSVFKKCCDAGLMTSTTLNRAQWSLTKKQFGELIECRVRRKGCVTLENLPREWSINVKREK